MSTISTHILNTASGRPGSSMKVIFEKLSTDGTTSIISSGVANADGRIPELVPANLKISSGVYRLTFSTSDYFAALGQKSFYPKVEVQFEIGSNEEHYHVPLLVSPFGFSTYRGT